MVWNLEIFDRLNFRIAFFIYLIIHDILAGVKLKFISKGCAIKNAWKLLHFSNLIFAYQPTDILDGSLIPTCEKSLWFFGFVIGIFETKLEKEHMNNLGKVQNTIWLI